MSRVSDLRQLMMEMDDRIATAIDTGSATPEQIALLQDQAVQLECEYYDMLDEQDQTESMMYNGLGVW